MLWKRLKESFFFQSKSLIDVNATYRMERLSNIVFCLGWVTAMQLRRRCADKIWSAMQPWCESLWVVLICRGRRERLMTRRLTTAPSRDWRSGTENKAWNSSLPLKWCFERGEGVCVCLCVLGGWEECICLAWYEYSKQDCKAIMLISGELCARVRWLTMVSSASSSFTLFSFMSIWARRMLACSVASLVCLLRSHFSLSSMSFSFARAFTASSLSWRTKAHEARLVLRTRKGLESKCNMGPLIDSSTIILKTKYVNITEVTVQDCTTTTTDTWLSIRLYDYMTYFPIELHLNQLDEMIMIFNALPSLRVHGNQSRCAQQGWEHFGVKWKPLPSLINSDNTLKVILKPRPWCFTPLWFSTNSYVRVKCKAFAHLTFSKITFNKTFK